jgi:hypothetical protein
VTPGSALVLVVVGFYVPLMTLAVWVWSLSRQAARFQEVTAYALLHLTAWVAAAAPGVPGDVRNQILDELERLVPRPRSPVDGPPGGAR